MSKIMVIERRSVDREYGYVGTEAIIHHPRHGRLLIADGFGGDPQSVAGQCVRWRHGMAVRLLPTDTLEALDDPEVWLDIINARDPQRPILGWDGVAVELVAKSAGLV